MRRLRIGATVRGTFDFALTLRVVVGCAGGWSVLLLVAMLVDWAFHSQLRWVGEAQPSLTRSWVRGMAQPEWIFG